jgi:two-component system nitrate/nitrite response regulator NarL
MNKNVNNLLIVEDHPYIRNKIKEEVKKINIFDAIHVSETLKEALNILNSTVIGTITLDLNLPDGNGLEILTHLREKNISKRVLVFSANPEMEKVSLRYGANYFFDKKNGIEPLVKKLKDF